MADDKKTNPGKGMAIAAMVCGIIAVLSCAFALVAIPCGIVALVLGIIALVKKKDGKGMAIAGVATGGVGLLASIVLLVLSFMAVDFLFNTAGDVIENTDFENVFSELEDATDKINACLEEKGVAGKDAGELTPEEQSAYVECL